MTNPDSVLKKRHYSAQKGPYNQAFSVVMYGSENWTRKKAEPEELILTNCDAGEHSCRSLGQQRDQTSQS